ncbi:hypothetical protein MMC32_001277 [Xylographa parallela]|nr:hypothetical protein [Xylographa parallela]
MTQSSSTPVDLGTILVIGGCGFLGYHLISALRADTSVTYSSIHVLSRNPQNNRHSNVTYHSGDIEEATCLPPIFSKIAPRIIFHCASPTAYQAGATASSFQRAIVTGTKNVLAAAAAEPSVLALIYTSSTSVVVGNTVVHAKEADTAVLTAASRANNYSKAKAVADTLVLGANNPLRTSPPSSTGHGPSYSGFLRTLVLRTTAMYGERDQQVIAGLLTSFRAGETRYQLGDNGNLFDWLYVGNAAQAHVQAAKALSAGASDANAPKVDGEAFFITDDMSLPFWDFVRMVWRAMGDTTPKEKLIVVPTWLALMLAHCTEWAVWAASLGKKRPELLNVERVEYSCFEHTYCIEKAKELLGYKPVASVEEGVQMGVEYALKIEKEKDQKMGP